MKMQIMLPSFRAIFMESTRSGCVRVQHRVLFIAVDRVSSLSLSLLD